jgi:hypothetical protein
MKLALQLIIEMIILLFFLGLWFVGFIFTTFSLFDIFGDSMVIKILTLLIGFSLLLLSLKIAKRCIYEITGLDIKNLP